MRTSKYILRELHQNDVSDIFELRASETVNRYIDRPIATSLQDAFDFIAKINGIVKNGDGFYWVISTAEEQKFIGSVVYFNISKENKSAEIGYELLPEWHGKSVMQEVIPILLNHAFQTIKFDVIHAGVHADNIKSIKLLEKNNFKLKEEKTTEENFVFYELKNPFK